jgi:DNA-binding HxlR family transcriptional regulator
MNAADDNDFERSPCPVANVLDLFGDKWSLLIVRDLMLGKLRYGEFAQSMEGIPSNILASRLKRLEAAGVVARTVYCAKPVRHQYELTEKGWDLLPVLDAMAAWASKHVPGVKVFPRHRPLAKKRENPPTADG